MLRRLRPYRGLLAIVLVAALVQLWVRSSRRMDYLIVPLPGDHMILAASAYGGVIVGFGGDMSDDAGGGGFHSSGDDDDDSGGQVNAPADATANAADAANERHWLEPGVVQWAFLSGDNDLDVGFGLAGFVLCAGHAPEPNGSIAVPYWFLLALIPMLAALRRWKRWRIARMERRHLCVGCGYDLRGNTSGVCPECGRAIPGKTGGASADWETPVAPV